MVIKEVEKFRQCGETRKGFSLLACEGSHHIKVLPHRCKGRFCTSCATGETEEWSRLLQEDVFQVNHRDVIFTIDEGLREIFIQHRHLLKPQMDEAVAIVKRFIPFEMLRKQRQTVVLKLIRKGLNESAKKKVQPLLQKAYSEHGEGFYVYAPKQKGNVKEQLAYIGRYIRRPAISLKRIEA